MWLAFLPTFLYWYFLLLQVFLKKVGTFTNLFGKLLGARGIILLQLFACSMGCYPSSVRRKHQREKLRKLSVKNLIDAEERLGAFLFLGFSFLSVLKREIKEKERFFLLYDGFLYCGLIYRFYMFIYCCV